MAMSSLATRAEVDKQPRHRFRAAAMNTNRDMAGSIEIVVNRWSSDAERDKLMQVLFAKGPAQLLGNAAGSAAHGIHQTPDSIGWGPSLRTYHSAGPDDGERIVLMTDSTDRLLGSGQPAAVDRLSVHRHRAAAEQTTVKGKGRCLLATKIIADKDDNSITLENYDIQPVMLTDGQARKGVALEGTRLASFPAMWLSDACSRLTRLPRMNLTAGIVVSAARSPVTSGQVFACATSGMRLRQQQADAKRQGRPCADRRNQVVMEGSRRDSSPFLLGCQSRGRPGAASC
jgi:hypothetical protein